MKAKSEYNIFEKCALIEKYRVNAEYSHGSTSARKWYRRGISLARRGAKYDQKNYEYYYDYGEHDEEYEKKGRLYFERAALCFRRSAELGNDLAMMNYALYLYALKKEYAEALKWFRAASEHGLAVADYELAVFCKKGCCGMEIDAAKAEEYFTRYLRLRESDERQLILSWDVPDDWTVIGRAFMYSWFSGYSFPETYDTPSARPSRWKYGG